MCMSEKVIYLLDDDEYTREVLKLELEERGYLVKVHETIGQLLVSMSGVFPDLFLLDYYLAEGKNGCQFATNFRSVSGNAIPIIFMSADTKPSDECSTVENSRFLLKQQLVELPTSIESLLAKNGN